MVIRNTQHMDAWLDRNASARDIPLLLRICVADRESGSDISLRNWIPKEDTDGILWN